MDDLISSFSNTTKQFSATLALENFAIDNQTQIILPGVYAILTYQLYHLNNNYKSDTINLMIKNTTDTVTPLIQVPIATNVNYREGFISVIAVIVNKTNLPVDISSIRQAPIVFLVINATSDQIFIHPIRVTFTDTDNVRNKQCAYWIQSIHQPEDGYWSNKGIKTSYSSDRSVLCQFNKTQEISYAITLIQQKPIATEESICQKFGIFTSGLGLTAVLWLLVDCIARYVDTKGRKFGRNIMFIFLSLGYVFPALLTAAIASIFERNQFGGYYLCLLSKNSFLIGPYIAAFVIVFMIGMALNILNVKATSHRESQEGVENESKNSCQSIHK
ncbi:uncharacterized protein TRIADDRAFT_59355 [Trichoplax adhaerens]|uniref:G-protein coupled receptors family 2 profile 2 domain-containing protein n=1 Tax=Trichoplax adhaerens TaxID=10228 RepID=B3S4V0_TRIAD|nr:hypothetical protein TRIADDRAFT_59355 [Trichoplax adhaerens]EDV22274.1 hypothetical protein TRIADDRAFT_59355 [Trichoplax adhaerens]|eukprot:XP_002115429.1 hypothetical protein TRIADDRAFT_59355 [Trichoplax adhaerens]